LGSGDGITVFTASRWTDTRVTVALDQARPRLHLDECDHVVEAGFSIRSGRLHIYGPEGTNANEYGDQGADTYALHLWPGPLLKRRVLKDGFTWMD
jgi:hypothetical protein